MNRRIFSILFVFCLLSGHLSAQQKQSAVLRLSLEQAQNYAYEHNYDLINSGKDVQIARKQVQENTAIGLPQISAGIDYMDNLKTPTTVIPNFIPDTTGMAPKTLEVKFGVKYNVTASLSASQLIYSGQYLVGLQTAKAFLETSKQQDVRNKVNVRDQVADNYCLLLVLDQGLQILDSTYVVVNRLLHEAQVSYENGLIEDIDVEQAELRRSNLEAMVIDTRSNRNIVNARFKYLLGLKEDIEIELTDNLDFFLAQVDRDALIAQPFDYKNNIDYTVLQRFDYLQLMRYKLAKTAYQPTLVGFFSYNQSAQRNEWTFLNSGESWFNSIKWGLSLSVPIWSSGSRKFAVDQARINVEKTKVNNEKMQMGLQLQVETAKKDFSNSYAVFTNKKKGFVTALKIFDKTATKYKMGLSSSTDLNQQYSQFLQANQDYLQSIYTVLSSRIQLLKLLEKF